MLVVTKNLSLMSQKATPQGVLLPLATYLDYCRSSATYAVPLNRLR